MGTTPPEYRSEVLKELERIPAEFLPAFLKLARAFREGVTHPSAEENLRQGWEQAFASMAEQGDDQLLDPDLFGSDWDAEEWQWD